MKIGLLSLWGSQVACLFAQAGKNGIASKKCVFFFWKSAFGPQEMAKMDVFIVFYVQKLNIVPIFMTFEALWKFGLTMSDRSSLNSFLSPAATGGHRWGNCAEMCQTKVTETRQWDGGVMREVVMGENIRIYWSRFPGVHKDSSTNRFDEMIIWPTPFL